MKRVAIIIEKPLNTLLAPYLDKNDSLILDEQFDGQCVLHGTEADILSALDNVMNTHFERLAKVIELDSGSITFYRTWAMAHLKALFNLEFLNLNATELNDSRS